MKRLGSARSEQGAEQGLAGGYGCVYALGGSVNLRGNAINHKDLSDLDLSYEYYELEDLV